MSVVAPKTMDFGVFGLGHNDQIFDAIIQSLMVQMMDLFFRFKETTKMLFHYQPMFKDIMLIVMGMIRAMCPAITKFVNPSPTEPSNISLHNSIGSCLSGWRISGTGGSVFGRMPLHIRLRIAKESSLPR